MTEPVAGAATNAAWVAGGYKDEDEHVGEQYDEWAENECGGVWTLPAWHYSPDALIAQARAQNNAGFSSAFANAGKHSNPPAWSPDHELSQ
jgi:hypothetical protein